MGRTVVFLLRLGTTSHQQAIQRTARFIRPKCYLGRQRPSLWKSPHSSFFPPAFLAGHDITWWGTSLWAVGGCCPGCVPSPPPVHSQPPRWWGSEERQRPRVCVSNKSSIGMLWTLFVITEYWYRAPYEQLWINITLSQPKPLQTVPTI